jgi:hypothetical protein
MLENVAQERRKTERLVEAGSGTEEEMVVVVMMRTLDHNQRAPFMLATAVTQSRYSGRRSSSTELGNLMQDCMRQKFHL